MTIPNDMRHILALALQDACRLAGCGGEQEIHDAYMNALDWLAAQPVMPEPDWNQAPEWAIYHIFDPAGMWAWWLEKWPKHPQLISHMFVGKWMPYDNPLPVGIDYRTTLSFRPKESVTK